VRGLIGELKRRNVLRVGLAYLVASWLLLQIVDVIGPILRLPESFARYLLFLLIVGLIPALVFAWVFEMTPEGVKRESEVDPAQSMTRRTGRRLDQAIMVTLALAVGVLLFDKLVLDEKPSERGVEPSSTRLAEASAPAAEQRSPSPLQKSVAVLPFAVMSSGPDDDYFADGLTEEIINALAQVPDLLVTARTSAFHFKGQNQPIAEIAGQLGVAHVVEGSVRRAGEQLRITAQLIRAEDGFHLWSETYDRRTADTFAVQTDISAKVAGALNVILDDDLRRRMKSVGIPDTETFIAFQKGLELYERAHSEPNQISLLRQANRWFETAMQRTPDSLPAYRYHSDLYSHILLASAAGELEGDITDEDIGQAPAKLRQDYDLAVRNARTAGERYNFELDRALQLGPWNGLALLSANAMATQGCETALWLHLLGPFPSLAERVLESYQRMRTCDPLRVRSAIHQVSVNLWLGNPGQSIRLSRESMERFEHPLLSTGLALALAFSGDMDGAERAATSYIRTENDLLRIRSMLAALRGDAAAAAGLQQDMLARYGPNDRATLALEAIRGNRSEANRLAGQIDARPFGHMVLLQAIFFCYCGAPFDLETTPVFASLLKDSGLKWPPARPYDLPLKDW
jgi:TolB-like protein